MTDPVQPLFKAGDKATMPSIAGVVTIRSWPVENEGYFMWEQYHPDGNVALRGNAYYGDNREGEPVNGSVVPVPYHGTEGYPITVSAEPAISLDDLPGLPAEDVAEPAADAADFVAGPTGGNPVSTDTDAEPAPAPEVTAEAAA